MFIKLMFSIVLVVSLTGCFSRSSYQTADTLNQGEFEIGAGVTLIKSTAEVAGEYDKNKATTYISPELLLRFGLVNNLDLGLKATGAGAELDFKFRFLSFGDETNRFSFAIRPFISADFEDDIEVNKAGASLLISKKVSKTVSFYLVGNYHPIKKLHLDDKTSDFSGVLGVSINSKHFWFRPELVISDLNSELVIFPGIGMGFTY